MDMRSLPLHTRFARTRWDYAWHAECGGLEHPRWMKHILPAMTQRSHTLVIQNTTARRMVVYCVRCLTYTEKTPAKTNRLMKICSGPRHNDKNYLAGRDRVHKNYHPDATHPALQEAKFVDKAYRIDEFLPLLELSAEPQWARYPPAAEL